mmetsp:Transcript_25696/g.22710  ORF Transcript_25696/g.22710 Transcript_25696/m.22710 type:complete len:205 (-) Transcript_25696:214-828(-)
MSHMHVLANRIQLAHTALMHYFTEKYTEEGLDSFIDLCLRESYISAIQVGAPHLVRYLLAAFVLQKSSPKFDLNKLTNLLPSISEQVCKYNDSLSKFLKALLEDFDFKTAHKLIQNFKTEFEGDYFLGKHIQTLINNAQTIFFEVYCKIYRKIEIKVVANYLGVNIEDAEIWIVNLIRSAKFSAKVNPEEGVIYLEQPKTTVYE